MVLARLVQAGNQILEGDRFIRVQCKTGALRNGVISFNICSVDYHHPNSRGSRPYRRDYFGDAELFGVYCQATDSVYLVPVEDVGRRTASLRIEPTRNGQAKKIRWAKNYLLSSP